MTMTEGAPFKHFDEAGGLVFATALPGSAADFADRRRTWSDLNSTGDAPLWVHLNRTCERAQRWLRAESGLAPLVVDSLLAEETRPQCQRIGAGLLVILRGVNMNPGAEPDDLIAIRMWIEPKRIITLRQFRFATVVQLREQAMRGEAPKTPGGLLAAVAMGLAQRMGPSVENLEEMVDEIEAEMLESEVDDAGKRSQLAEVRRQAITYRRYLVPQRDALMNLSLLESPLLSEQDKLELRVAAERVARVTESLEETRDRAAVTQDEMRARHEVRMGRTLYLLTIIATIALPLGLLTGLLGINVGGIPLSESSYGFIAVCVIMGMVAIGELIAFRRMKWL